MEVCARIFNGYRSLTMFVGHFVLDVWRGSECDSVVVFNNVLLIQSFAFFFEMLIIENYLTISYL